MQSINLKKLGAIMLAATFLAGPVSAHGTGGHTHDHDARGSISEGYFENDQVKQRTLSDWAGEWQSVYPYLVDGTLDPVMAHKAEQGDKTAAEYRAYYDVGYKTDTSRVVIDGDRVSFTDAEGTISGQYETDGHEILTYAKGNRGVRFVFKKIAGDEAAPGFIQFSDHIIAPQKSDHFHLYWGNDRQALLGEMDHWPTYYPATLSSTEVAAEMMAH